MTFEKIDNFLHSIEEPWMKHVADLAPIAPNSARLKCFIPIAILTLRGCFKGFSHIYSEITKIPEGKIHFVNASLGILRVITAPIFGYIFITLFIFTPIQLGERYIEHYTKSNNLFTIKEVNVRDFEDLYLENLITIWNNQKESVIENYRQGKINSNEAIKQIKQIQSEENTESIYRNNPPGTPTVESIEKNQIIFDVYDFIDYP